MSTIAEMELIGVGRQAEVYAINESECVKLFYESCPTSVIENEAERMRFVTANGVPSPRFIALEKIDGRYGIRMERLYGITLLHEALERFNPETDYGGILGDVQREFHKIKAQGLGDMVDALEWQINKGDTLPEAAKKEMVRRLRAMPRGDRLVHMDYHSDNVIMTPNGARVIDWTSACIGNPLADAARTLLTMELLTYPVDADDSMRAWIDATRDACRECYLRGYGVSDEELAPWKPIIAASRAFCSPEEECVQNVRLVLKSLDEA